MKVVSPQVSGTSREGDLEGHLPPRQPAGIGDQEKGAARDIVNAGGGRASLGRARRACRVRRARRVRGARRIARPRLDEHDRLTADDAMTITGERENRGDDDEVELVVEGRAQLGQIGLAQNEGAPPATGEDQLRTIRDQQGAGSPARDRGGPRRRCGRGRRRRR